MRMPRTARTLTRIAALLAVSTVPMFAAVSIVTSSLPVATVGAFYSVGFSVSGGVAPYSWSAGGSVPPGLMVSAGGSINGTPTAAGSYTFTLSTTDSQGAWASRTLTLVVTGSAMSITTTGALPPATLGQNYSFTLTASGGAPPYRWTAAGGVPPGLTLDVAKGVFSGIPTAAGTFSFAVQVTDGAQAGASANLTLRVVPAPLTISTAPPIFTGTLGIPYSQPFSASGGVPPYTWSILSGSTGGLSLDSAAGALGGKPAIAGTFDFTLQVSDAAGATTSRSFSLTVSPPVLTLLASASLPAGAVGSSYNQKLPLSAVGGTPPYHWNVVNGALPPGLDFAADTLTISGEPTGPGLFSFSIQVADAAGQKASKPLTLTIAPGPLTLTTGRVLPEASLNVPYRASIAASGGAPPYTWSAAGLPAGLAIDPSTGSITGTPTAAGAFPLAITVSDAALVNASDRFTLNVKLPPPPPISLSGLPAAVDPATQLPLTIALASPFSAPITGQAILTFSPETGVTDKTVQFASGGNVANFSIPAGATAATSDVPLAIQTGTVAGTITVSVRLQAAGVDITPLPAPAMTAAVGRSAPVITGVQVNRSAGKIEIAVSGYSTSREVTQATFTFAAASGQTLQAAASSIVIPVESLFGAWFQNPSNGAYGSQFVLTQPFSIQGDSSAVVPQTVTLTNRSGSVTRPLQ